MNNALSIDLENWWCNEFFDGYLPEHKEDQILESSSLILNLLDKYNVKATFFVLGKVAQSHLELIEKIAENGHEIACHGYSHKMLHKLGKEGLEKEIIKSKKILNKYKLVGFRAPSFSVNNSTSWVFNILEKHGFEYDSSIFPFKSGLYGVPDAPLHPYKPSEMDVTKNDPDGTIVEFPLTVLRRAGVNIPIAGGFYLRALPLWFLKWAIKKVNDERPAIIYVHPWELYQKTPRINAPLKAKFIAYNGVNSAFRKLESLIKEFRFKTVREILHEV